MTIVLAIVAALLFGAGVALQQDEARAATDRAGLRAGLLVHLAGRPRWLAGLGLDIGGWGFQAWALAVGSLIVVQPLIAINLVFALALAAAFAGQPLSRGEWLAVTVTLVGLVVFLTVGGPTAASSTAAATPREWLTMLAVVGGAVVLLCSLGLTGRRTQRAALLGAAAACCEALMAVLSKSFADRLGDDGIGATFTGWQPYAVVLGGIVTMVVVQSAYQVGRPTVSLPVNAVTEPIVAVTVGVVLFHEHLHLDPLRAPVVVGAIAAMIVGLVALATASARAEDAATVSERCVP